MFNINLKSNVDKDLDARKIVGWETVVEIVNVVVKSVINSNAKKSKKKPLC